MTTGRNQRIVRDPRVVLRKPRREGRCRLCGVAARVGGEMPWDNVLRPGLRITAHHVLPQSRGGNDEDANIVPVCFRCHQLEHELGWVAFGRLLWPVMTDEERLYARRYIGDRLTVDAPDATTDDCQQSSPKGSDSSVGVAREEKT